MEEYKNDKVYDHIIVGGGPSGMTLAYYLSKYNKKIKIVVIDANESLGGCHRVTRLNGFFTEHGPRIYSGAYLNYIHLLNNMGIDFKKVHVPYKSTAIQRWILEMKPRELFYLGLEFVKGICKKANTTDRTDTIYEFAEEHKFSESSIDNLDRICRLIDGGTVKTTTMYQFMELLNQPVFYKLYTPVVPHDVGIFKLWTNKLIEQNVDILLGTKIISMERNMVKTSNDVVIRGKNIILAIPPVATTKLLNESPRVQDMFGNFSKYKKWTKKTKYINYISATFHWNKKIMLNDHYGYEKTDWGIMSLILSNYMKFNDDRSKTVISVCTSIDNVPSSFINKTPHECEEQELLKEIFRQLKIMYPKIPEPTYGILSPKVQRVDGKWLMIDTPFMLTKYGNLPYITTYKNIFSVGHHNGNNVYPLNSIETAITNAIHLTQHLEPKTKNIIPILTIKKTTKRVLTLIIILFIFIIIAIFLHLEMKN